MKLLQVFAQAFGIGLSGAAMPGPLLTYNIQLTYKKGFWVGPRLVLGHAILEALLVLGIIAGLGSLIQLTVTKVILWFVGGSLLAWMGYDLVFKESRKPMMGQPETAAALEPQVVPAVTNLDPVLAGIVISFSNPYWLLWWATIGLTLITTAMEFGLWGVLIFYTGHIMSDLIWYSLISLAIAKGKRYLSDRAYRFLLIVCGVFLLYIAISFVFKALETLGVTGFLTERVVDLFLRSKGDI